MRKFTDNVLNNLNDALNAVQLLETITNTPLLKFKVDSNLQFRRRTVDGKEIRLTLDNVLDEFKEKIDGKKLAIITEQTGTSLEFMDIKKQVTAAEVGALADIINKECAAAYDIPLGVFNGQITEQSDATNEFITYAVSPVAEVINDTLNAKLVGERDYIKGERTFVWLAHFKHIDVIDAASNLDKLRAIGFTLDEIFEMVGYPALNTEFSTSRALTKNYATEGQEKGAQPTGGADDPFAPVLPLPSSHCAAVVQLIAESILRFPVNHVPRVLRRHSFPEKGIRQRRDFPAQPDIRKRHRLKPVLCHAAHGCL